MAQADSVPTPVSSLITGADPEHSTNQGATAGPTRSLRQGADAGEGPFVNRRCRPRRYFIGGSDTRVIMGDDEDALIRLWREKRGEVDPEDLSGNLIVQLGLATEELNRRWYQANTGQVLTDVQRQIRHPALRWMAATP
jgi:YqaJ-like viral recombinase domain